MAEFQSEEKGPVVQTWSFTSNLVLLNLWTCSVYPISILDDTCCLWLWLPSWWCVVFKYLSRRGGWQKTCGTKMRPSWVFLTYPLPQGSFESMGFLPCLPWGMKRATPLARRFVPIEVSSQEKHVSKNSNDSLPTPIGSMGLVNLPTWMVDFYGKCR